MKYPNTNESIGAFLAWQPSTWPGPPPAYSEEFRLVLEKIFRESLLSEIENVINDTPTLEHRGHVVALSVLCAVDSLSSYAFRDIREVRCTSCGRTDRVGLRYQKYIGRFFPDEYKPFAEKIYKLYRNSIAHSWNLFEAGLSPGDDSIKEVNGTICFGLKHFASALNESVKTFIDEISSRSELQDSALLRYRELRVTARP